MDWQPTKDSSKNQEDEKQKDYWVAKLLPKHASLVNNSWKFKNSLSLQMLEGLIQQGKLLGLFIYGHAEPIAWITIYRSAW